MNCQTIMTQPPAILTARTAVGLAMKALLSSQLSSLPVVDESGVCLGMFSLRTVMGIMLPRAATIAEHVDLAFVNESPDVLRSRLQAIADDPVERHLERDFPHVTPETSLVEAVLLMYRGRRVLPVIDGGNKLLGIVTASSAVARILGNI